MSSVLRAAALTGVALGVSLCGGDKSNDANLNSQPDAIRSTLTDATADTHSESLEVLSLPGEEPVSASDLPNADLDVDVQALPSTAEDVIFEPLDPFAYPGQMLRTSPFMRSQDQLRGAPTIEDVAFLKSQGLNFSPDDLAHVNWQVIGMQRIINQQAQEIVRRHYGQGGMPEAIFKPERQTLIIGTGDDQVVIFRDTGKIDWAATEIMRNAGSAADAASLKEFHPHW